MIKVDLTGKTVMVVGANTGLGFETCKHFSLMNPTRIILVCRDKARGEAAVASAGLSAACCFFNYLTSSM